MGEEDDAEGVAGGIEEGLFADEDFGGLAGGELGVFGEVFGFLRRHDSLVHFAVVVCELFREEVVVGFSDDVGEAKHFERMFVHPEVFPIGIFPHNGNWCRI